MEKRFSQRCKCCDGKKKEETNVRMMKTLYPGRDRDRDRYYDWLLHDMGIRNQMSKHVGRVR